MLREFAGHSFCESGSQEVLANPTLTTICTGAKFPTFNLASINSIAVARKGSGGLDELPGIDYGPREILG